jgi:hypothetical protein
MSRNLTPPDPARFGLASFAELLAARPPILGEELDSFETFHDGMMRALTPFTAYECVIVENLIAIEWELYQHRRMRDAALRRELRQSIYDALLEIARQTHEADLDAAWERFIEDGGDEDDWEEPFEFDKAAAEERAHDLAARAVSPDRTLQAAAQAELVEIGLSPLDLMGAAYEKERAGWPRHDAKVKELEIRRREVKRDYDALQAARPVEAEVAEVEVVEG